MDDKFGGCFGFVASWSSGSVCCSPFSDTYQEFFMQFMLLQSDFSTMLSLLMQVIFIFDIYRFVFSQLYQSKKLDFTINKTI